MYHAQGSFFIDYTCPCNSTNSADSDDNNSELSVKSTLGLVPLDPEGNGCEPRSLFVGDYDSQVLSGQSDELRLIH